MGIDVGALARQLREDAAGRRALRSALLGDAPDLEQAVAGLADAQRALQEEVRQLAAAQRITEDAVRSLVAVVSGMNDRLGKLDGDALERKYRERGHAYLSRVARRLRLVDHDTLSPMVDDAQQAGTISGFDADSLLLVDAVFSGRRHGDRAPVHLAVEASVTVGRYDLRRARERAALLERIVGTPVLAVAAGEMAPARSSTRPERRACG